MTITVDELCVADPVQAWARAGFNVDADAVCRVGDVRLRLGSDSGAGIVGWALRGVVMSCNDIDGIPTTSSQAEPTVPADHPNGVTAIDHIVLMSPNLDRTVSALGEHGVQPRRVRDGELGGRPMRQIFFRFGGVIIEVVGPADATEVGPSRLWGITYVVADIDATAGFFGDQSTPLKDAVQPGRRISTLRHRAFGMSVPTALISPPILGP